MQESAPTAAMLDIGPAVLTNGCHIEAISRLDKSGLLFCQSVSFRLGFEILRSPKILRLRFTHRFSHSQFQKVGSHIAVLISSLVSKSVLNSGTLRKPG